VREQAERVVDARYENLAADGPAVPADLAAHLGVRPGPLAAGFTEAHGDSAGRYHAELTAEEVADVEAEAGPLLRELGYR
jgi:hypothetical protein